MGYIDKNLTAGETVLYETRLHWIVMVRSIVVACVLVVAAGFVFYYAQRMRRSTPTHYTSSKERAVSS